MRGSYIWSSREAEMTHRELRESASGAFTRVAFSASLPAAPLLWPCDWQQQHRRAREITCGRVAGLAGPPCLLPGPGSGPAQGFPLRRHSSNYPGNRRGWRQEAAAR